MFQENCYVVSDETNECIIIDCGALYKEEKDAISKYIKGNNLSPKHLLCTHGHIDHNFGNKFIYDKYGLKPEISMSDKWLMDNLAQQAKDFTGIECKNDFPVIESYLDEKSIITFGSHSIIFIPTPGHTPGSAFLYIKSEKIAFSGDTLFKLSVGRTDLGLGDYSALMNSLNKISSILPDNTIILPGHGSKTTMEYERSFNPYLKAVKG